MNPIEYAIAEYRPIRIFAMFSGGDGSLSATHYSMEHGAHEVFHIRTGVGVEERPGLDVEEFVRETCKAHGWPLIVKNPPDWDYRTMVLRKGFPGPGAHLYPYVWLKDRAIAQLMRETKKHRMDRVGFCTGVRNSDSARRMGYVAPVVKVKARIWIAPLFSQSTIEVYDYIKQHNLKRSPIAELIGMSGECFCGAFAKPGEIQKIERYFPKLAAQLHALEAEAKACGSYSIWGVRPPKKSKGQQDIPFMPLCVNCHGQNQTF